MVNVETLNLLQQFWRKYSIYTNPSQSNYGQFEMDCKTVISRMEPLLQTPWLARSFGPRVHESTPIAAHYTSKFWKSGTVDPRGEVQPRQCNPLFVFSSFANDKFAIHWSTNPLCGFHLAPSITELAHESYLYHWNNDFGRIDGERAFESALITAQRQFAAWCKAFQNLARKVINGNSQGGGLRIRIFVGDAVEFCLALARPVNSYSRPYTVHPLRLDGAVPTANDGTPVSFNVIDTSTLTEFVGSINLLTATIPLLQKSPSSVLYVETLRPDLYDDETKLLSDILRTDNVRSMCTLLGLVPTPYVTAVSTRSKTQSELINKDTKVPSLNRISWKFSTSMDPNSLGAKAACDPSSLARLLYDVYLKMFSHESINYYQQIMRQPPTNRGAIRFPPLIYSRRSYAALLAFLKPRIAIDWNDFMGCLLRTIESDQQLMLGQNSIQELFLQLHLAGVHSRHPVGQRIGDLTIPGYPPLSSYRHDRGILKHNDPPCITCLIISIPRRKLQILYKSSVDEGIRVSMMFQINILTKMFHNTFSSIHPVFGKLSASDDGQTCTIEEDMKGWHGSADLHLCVCLPTYMLLMTDPREVEVSVRLQPDGSTTMAFRSRLGIELEVFKSRLLDKNHVQLLRSFPGLETPRPPTIVTMGKKLMVSNDKMELTYPELFPESQKFTTRNTFRGKEEREQLKSGAAVAFKAISLCSVVITFGTVKYNVNFSYPIEGSSIHVRIARKSGWIEVTATLLSPPTEESFSRDPFPLLRLPNHGVSSWNLPYINLRRLPEINVPVFPGGRKSWLVAHSDSMFSDYHTSQEGNLQKSHLLGDVKLVIEAMIAYVGGVDGVPQRVWGINLMDQPELAVFITGLYLDNCSHSVVAEAYVLPLMNLPPHLSKTFDQLFTNALGSKLPSDTLNIFKRSLRTMAERCRDWEHSETCEFAVGETIPDVEDGKSPFCSCGVGKVQNDFRNGRWKEFSQFVTRVAITPIFAVPYMEPAKTVFGKFTGGPRILKKQLRDTNPGPVCQTCGKEGFKRCSRCEAVYYCGRECQIKDWQKHKPICRKTGS